MYGRGFRIARAAGVVPRVLERGPADGEPRLRARPRFCLHRDASPGSVVVDHAVIMVPEHVLRRCWTLESEI